MIKTLISALSLLAILSLSSCVDNPYKPQELPDVNDTSMVAIVLNEGLLSSNESSLTAIYKDDEGHIIDNSFARKNGEKLGDLGNSMIRNGNTLYTIISNSALLLTIDIESEEIIEFQFEKGANPRYAVIEDDKMFVTLQSIDKVIELNIATMTKTREFETGPAPEGLAYHNGYLYVANSGLGEFRADDENASTISKINIANGQTEYIPTGDNPIHIAIDEGNNFLYLAYQNFWWKTEDRQDPEFVGGIIEYELSSMEQLREWKTIPLSMRTNFSAGEIYLVSERGLEYIDLNSNSSTTNQLYTSPEGSNLYGLGIHPNGNEIWLLDALDYTNPGNLMIYNIPSSSVTETFQVGRLPKDIIFK